MKTKIPLLLLLLVISVSCSMTFPVAKATIKVVDELGNPIEGAKASISFELSKVVSESGVTGSDGVFSASHRTAIDIAFGAEKQGYYKSYGKYSFTTSKTGRWQPWNPVFTLVLRKIGDPVPMYACQLRTVRLPYTNKKIGFDLIEYDLVSPYGKGKHADFIFNLEGKYNNEHEYDNTLTLTFSNKHDGIHHVSEDRKLGSKFKLPRFAPETGYKNKLTKSISRTPGQPYKSDSKEDNNYIFRIRSEEKNGKLLRAMYGKIQGDIDFGLDRGRSISITFTPYLNPDYSRNLEFDPKQNLYKDLKSFEHVGL